MMGSAIPTDKGEKADAGRATNTIPFDRITGVKPETPHGHDEDAPPEIDRDPENRPAPTSDDPRDRDPPERTLR